MTLQRVIESAGGTLPADLAGANGAGGKNPAAVALGHLGGIKGGKARARALSAAQRKAIARKAARVRWKKGR